MNCFYDNYVSLCAKVKKSPSFVAEAIGLSRTSPNGWKKGKQPTDVNLQKIADYFGITAEELVAEKEKTTTENSGGFSEKDKQLVSWFRSLPEEKQKAILSLGGAPEDLAE